MSKGEPMSAEDALRIAKDISVHPLNKVISAESVVCAGVINMR